ncbi:uncharacterized protein FSUBG_12343 [Fusarium subglutinans]|uniref:Uncharacterized protein n=1 Tax=Gibberella subglutinans TaxID=42677 RepID=A0A8H5L6S0_GIBSU|nr:uncharacterized protein FSUBG_12343 [Fusarium subglutinans]KAF5585754.1 hypothetical protein FSUBG_12343 [Fusarium subglutinans]
MFDDPNREPIGIAEMMNAVHNSQTEDDRTTFSRFLHFLGGQVKSTSSDNQPQTYLGVDALPVTIKDLKFLTAAVTEFDWDEDSWNCSPYEVWRAFRAERGIGREEVPITNADTKRYTLRSLKDAYRDIARQIRASRDGASRIEAPHRSLFDKDRENTAHEEEEDIRIDNIPLPPAEDTMETMTGNVSDMQTERTPFHPRRGGREPRRKALVDREETEDEEEDLRRNLHCGDESNDTHIMQGTIGNGTMSGLSFESPFTLPTVPTSLRRPNARLVPLTPVGPGENLTQRLQEERLENRVKYSEASIKKLLDTQNCHSEAIRNLQRHAGLQILPPHQSERVNGPAPTQRIGVLETQNETLVQQNQALRERIHQMANHADQHRAEWSRKVNALELENSTLEATLSQKEEDLRAEMARVSNQQVEWSQKTRSLEQENSTLLGIVSGKDEVLALQSEKVRSLEAQLNTMKASQQEAASSTEETVQSSNHRIPSNDHALLGSQSVGLPVQMESPDHFKQETDVTSQSDEFASLRGQIPSLEGDVGSPRREEQAETFAPAFLGVNDDYLGWYNAS